MKFLFLCNLFLVITLCSSQKYKVCSLDAKKSDCEQLGRYKDVHCNYNFHGIDCLLNVEYERTDFGRVTAEEALIAAPFVNNVVVLGEFRSTASKSEDSNYATAVLVRSSTVTGFKDLRNKKYCHPGFKYDKTVTDLLLKEFERTVLKSNNVDECANSGSVVEKELKTLSDFFGPSCRPGPWMDVEDIDAKLYKEYSKLCESCPGKNCTFSVRKPPFMQSLECLVNNQGDVALTTLDTAYEFFNQTQNIVKQRDYSYLCRDGRLQPLDNPCVWSKQPWDLIVSNQKEAEYVGKDLKEWFSKYNIDADDTASPSPVWAESLNGVLFPKDDSRMKFFDSPKLLKEYITEYRPIPTIENTKCQSNITWCTISEEEQQKCEWLAQASLNHAIKPILKCYKSDNEFLCLEDVHIGKADVVTSDAHYGYIARKKSLAPLAYPETYASYDLISTVVVVKDNDPNIKSFKDLKKKMACIPEYGGIEWLSFINTARDHNVLSKTACDYGELINEFVGESCIPGAHDQIHERSSNLDESKLCSLCILSPTSPTATTCNADDGNQYYGNNGALKCLKEAGDFAVVTKTAENINSTEFRVLCRNGSLAAYPGLNVDDKCVLVTIVDSEVVSRKADSSKNVDIGIVLVNFEKRFGTDRVKAFEVFNQFNNTKDLLFKDTTRGLAPANSGNQNIKNYLALFDHVDKCVTKDDKGSATNNYATVLTLVVASIGLLLFK